MKVRIKSLVACFIAAILTCLAPMAVFSETGVSPLVNQLNDIPTLYITLDDKKTVGNISKDEQLPGVCSLIADGFDPIEDAVMTIKGRGNSTWTLPKKPYQIKFDSKTDVLGMGKAKKWILLANYWDKTLMRNAVMYDLANKINNIFSVEFRFVDVYINGEYRGNYLLTEKIEFDKQRINDSTDDGAVLFELEQQYRHASDGCASCFETASGVHVTVKEPEVDEAFTQDQFDELKMQSQNKLNAVEAAIDEGYDSYSKLIDVDSFIDWYIENELAKNYDAAFVTSSYCYLDSTGILHMGPVWDVDVCFGNQDVTYPGTVDNGLNFYNYRSDKGAWYMSLFNDETFIEKLKSRWEELKSDGYIDGMFEKIDELYDALSESQKTETERWPDAMRVTVVRGKGTPYFDYDSEVKYFKQWLTDRVEWLDSQWNDSYCDVSDERRIDSIGGGGLYNGYFGKSEGGIWSWKYSRIFGNNRSVFSSEPFFKNDVFKGEYLCSAKFKYTSSDSTDYLMIRLVGTDSLGNETTVFCTPATHVTYETAVKDSDGYATVNMKFDTTDLDYKSYHFVLDAYNANVSLKNLTLYNVGDLSHGDANGDGIITASDALLVLQASVGKITFTDSQKTLCDVDGKPGISAADALMILQYSVGKIASL